MQKKNGFTLLEVLIVVVIAVSVAAFSVPAYKKTQEKNKYLAAQGVLLDLGTAVRAIRTDLDAFDKKFPNTKNALTVMNTYQNSSSSSYKDAANMNFNEDSKVHNTSLLYALFAKNYMAPIAYDSTSSGSYSVKGYTLIVCPQDQGTSSECCGNNKNVVACMWGGKAPYSGARFKTDGSIERID